MGSIYCRTELYFNLNNAAYISFVCQFFLFEGARSAAGAIIKIGPG